MNIGHAIDHVLFSWSVPHLARRLNIDFVTLNKDSLTQQMYTMCVTYGSILQGNLLMLNMHSCSFIA